MNDLYHFVADEHGEKAQEIFKEGLENLGRTVELGEIPMKGAVNNKLLTLTVTGKRPGEGKIAAAMKESE